MTKTVYAYHPETRVLIGSHVLDEGDLSPMETGVYLIPGNCLAAKPPAAVDGKLIVEQEGKWAYQDIPAPPEPEPAIPQTPEQLKAQLIAGIQAHLDTRAQACGYDGLTNAVTYAEEPSVPKFQAEGRAFRTWRSLCWAACYAYLDEVKAGTKTFPTVPEALALLPPLELP